MKNEAGDKEASKVVTLPMDHDDQEGHFPSSPLPKFANLGMKQKALYLCPYLFVLILGMPIKKKGWPI